MANCWLMLLLTGVECHVVWVVFPCHAAVDHGAAAMAAADMDVG